MCVIVIAGGPNKHIDPLLPYFRRAECVICADSGADDLVPYNIVPDKIWGDMDSIRPETRQWLREKQVPEVLFPIEKDMTDSEICLTSIPKEKAILFITSLTGRPDHVMGNLLLCARLVEEGYQITVTDGISFVFPLAGENQWRAESSWVEKGYACSLIPLGEGARAVSTKGMKYPLQDRDLASGSSFTISNEFDQTEKEHGFDMKDGTMLVIVTPKV
ncbi:MAG: thiamine diphosphokinase [Clostridiales bacterium]|nr:thiamine diphosphokinase [Clostridiales bacterium]